MKVLQVTKGSLMGGGEKHILTLLEGFKHRAVDTTLAVFTEGPLSAAARELGTEVYVIPKKYRGDVSPLLELIHLIKDKQIDIVHTHLISGNLYGRFAGKLTRVKGIVSTLHHSDKEALGQFFLPFMQNLIFRLDLLMTILSDRIITPSADLKNLIIKHGVREDKIVPIPNAVNLQNTKFSEEEIRSCRQEMGLPPGEKLVGTVGRLVPVKNFGLFLRAARQVIDSGIEAKFVLIGDGPLREELQEMTNNLGLTHHVVFAGFRENVFKVLSMLDVFVLCSNSETFPLALIEAMALKKPVISTNVGGVSEIIDHKVNGLLCPPGDEYCLVNSIINLLNHEEKTKDLGIRAWEKVNNVFSMKAMIDKLLQVYYELAFNKRQ